MAISKRTRWQILRRDNFACRYCGATANGGAILEVDHMHPSARGGSDDPANLITACEPCNGGKSDIPLGAPVVDDVPQDALRNQILALKRESLQSCIPSDTGDFDTTCAVTWSRAFPGEIGLRLWGAWGVSWNLALASGRTPYEILRACESAGNAGESDLFAHMPYAPEPVETVQEGSAYEQALESLRYFIPAELIGFIWAARRGNGIPQPTRRQLIRLAAKVADEYVEEFGRDWDELRRWLGYLPGDEGSRALVQATAEWDRVNQGRRGLSAWDCADEVLTLAVSLALTAEPVVS